MLPVLAGLQHAIHRQNAAYFSDDIPIRRHYSEAYQAEKPSHEAPTVIESFKQVSFLPPATCTLLQLAEDGEDWVGKQVVLHGYLGTQRVANKDLVFAEVCDIGLSTVIQLVSSPEIEASTPSIDAGHSFRRRLRDVEEHTPIWVRGTVQRRKAPKSSSASNDQTLGKPTPVTSVELKVEGLCPLNTFPKDMILSEGKIFPPEERHLQIRHDSSIRSALRFRSRVARFLRDHLADQYGFEEYETPLLFKSTPEGAREFLVPTRNAGMAYALPQSPQQYKQILMASGVSRYMQIARCFRDEDLRADRQPEFTQVDLEMAFATGEDVMRVIESTIKALWTRLLDVDNSSSAFARLTYEEAMSRYGSDKPDTRLGSEIRRVDYMLPVDLIRKIGPLQNPAVDVMKLSISEDPRQTMKFVEAFMDSPEARPFVQNPDGQPGIFIFDSRKPLQGLQPFGFEAAEQVEEMLELADGDLVVLQARKNVPFSGGSTLMGNLRLALYKAAVKQNQLPAPQGFAFLWITDFPLFSPTNDSDPGQGGAAGIASTHHPFTAPKNTEDIDLLLTDPLRVKADHYDLVVNGVELGGGSKRIHLAQMQEFIMRETLQMSDERMKDFEHLLRVLGAGCPPHAGFALGFDRLVAVMLGKESVREVIAFPKSGRGEDLLVKSPTRMTEEQLKTYHLMLRED